MIKKPKISVVMSAYNAEKYLREAIESILLQTFNDFEFIIIDDGSSDNTPKILKEYTKKDKRIKIITHKINKGLIASLNNGFKKAQGKYIARMDADDISFPDRLTVQYEYLERNPDIILLGSFAAIIDSKGLVSDIWSFLLNDLEIKIGLMFSTQYCHGTVMIRRSVIVKNNTYYDNKANYYEDYEYWPRLLEYGKGANLPTVLYNYRKVDTGITVTKRKEMLFGTELIRYRESKRVKLMKNNLFEIFKIYFIQKYLKIKIEGKMFNTHLNVKYQDFLMSLSRYYIKEKKYSVSMYYMLLGIFVYPKRFIKVSIFGRIL